MSKIKGLFKVKFGLLSVDAKFNFSNKCYTYKYYNYILCDFNLKLKTQWTKTENYFNMLKMAIFCNLITR